MASSLNGSIFCHIIDSIHQSHNQVRIVVFITHNANGAIGGYNAIVKNAATPIAVFAILAYSNQFTIALLLNPFGSTKFIGLFPT